jgi:hypothetical protein
VPTSVGTSQLVVVAALWIINASVPGRAQETRSSALNGVVRSDDGSPVVGATVFIYTAGPRKGLGIL